MESNLGEGPTCWASGPARGTGHGIGRIHREGGRHEEESGKEKEEVEAATRIAVAGAGESKAFCARDGAGESKAREVRGMALVNLKRAKCARWRWRI